MIQYTRGNGLLEGYLAIRRAKKVDSLIQDSFRSGRILDIGCGTYPYFLHSINFRCKYGLEIRSKSSVEIQDDCKIFFTPQKNKRLQFQDNYFDVVTMLAVLEHNTSDEAALLTAQIHRVLKPGGLFLLTVPPVWSNSVLKVLALFKLVSSEEIRDHKNTYTINAVRKVLTDGGFSEKNIQLKYFELFFNIAGIAKK